MTVRALRAARRTDDRSTRDRSDEGFTLIELLVVVVIIGILIGIAVPVYLNYRKSANDKAAQSDLRGAISTLEVCNSDNGKYPSAVPDAGGALTDAANGCVGTIAKTDNTTFKYFANTARTSYIMTSINSGGSSNRYYCYASATGGSVKTVSAAATAYADAC